MGWVQDDPIAHCSFRQGTHTHCVLSSVLGYLEPLLGVAEVACVYLALVLLPSPSPQHLSNVPCKAEEVIMKGSLVTNFRDVLAGACLTSFHRHLEPRAACLETPEESTSFARL